MKLIFSIDSPSSHFFFLISTRKDYLYRIFSVWLGVSKRIYEEIIFYLFIYFSLFNSTQPNWAFIWNIKNLLCISSKESNPPSQDCSSFIWKDYNLTLDYVSRFGAVPPFQLHPCLSLSSLFVSLDFVSPSWFQKNRNHF